MARKRMIDPAFFLDEELAKLSPHARLLYIGSWQLADDNVYTLPHRPEWIKAQLFPYEKVNMEEIIHELITCGKFVIFEKENKKYIYIKNMGEYQKIDHPSKQKYPEYSSGTLVSLTEPSPSPLKKPPQYNIIQSNIIQEFFDYFLLKTKRAFTLTSGRASIIEARLKTHSIEQLKKAVDNFVLDTWEDRHKFTDIVYCIGIRNKIDNLEKWLNWQPTKGTQWKKP